MTPSILVTPYWIHPHVYKEAVLPNRCTLQYLFPAPDAHVQGAVTKQICGPPACYALCVGCYRRWVAAGMSSQCKRHHDKRQHYKSQHSKLIGCLKIKSHVATKLMPNGSPDIACFDQWIIKKTDLWTERSEGQHIYVKVGHDHYTRVITLSQPQYPS